MRVVRISARRRTSVASAGACGLITALVVGVLAPVGAAASSPAASSVASGLGAGTSHPVTKSNHVVRTFLDNGVTKTVDSRTVKVTVSDTRNLRSLQQVNVSWSGAHATDGTELDPNSDLAMNEEYSFDLFECRGLDSTSVPVKDRISPQTCWTQFSTERYFSQGSQPAWQSDLYASTAERQTIVGAPPTSKQPAECKPLETQAVTQRWIPFVGSDGKVFDGGPSGCAGLPPEASPSNFSNLSLPSNETFAVTAPDGTGTAKFDIFTGEDHASLGCSDKVPCSLVAIPIEGLSCDPEGANLPASQQPTQAEADLATTNCEAKGNFKPGQLLNNVEASGDPAVDGTLWWSASNWRNRISFPLTFAQRDDVCNIVSNLAPISIYGSELMTQAASSWSPHFCLNPKLFNPKLVQTPEPEARRLVASGTVEAALGSYGPSPPYPVPTVNAPVAVSGFGIAFDVDNASHRPVTVLRLDARLLAKLLTESYPADTFVRDAYPTTDGVATLSNNPLTITADPEFQALNPGIPPKVIDQAAALLTINVQSDVMTALTTYINDDPAARAWLNGQPDPWGMRVNPNYKGIKLPVSSWPLLDTFEPTDEYQLGRNDCLAVDPVPFLPLVSNPQASLYQIAIDADFSISQSQTTCVLPSPTPGDTTGAKMVPNGRQPAGFRFMLSVVSLADAARFDLPLASLQTTSSVAPASSFSSAAGQTFVAPTPASLRAAVATVQPDSTSGTWPIDPKTLRSSKNAAAYPGTMILYTSIPTKGLPTADAKDYAELLRYAAGPGQVQGSAPGELPAGYLPLTSANDLGGLANYTQRAAAAVENQKGTTPPLIAPTTTGKKGGGKSGGKKGGPGGSSTSNPVGAPPTQPAVSTPPTSPAATTPKTTGSSPHVAPGATPAALGITQRISAGLGGDALPVLFILLLLTGGAAAGIRLRIGRRG